MDPLPPSRRRSGFYSPLSTPPPRSAASPSPPPTPIPTSPEITVLSSPLACVGISKSAERACNERIRKYIVWPERSLFEWQQQRAEAKGSDVESPLMARERPFISYTRTDDGGSLVTEVKALRGMFPEGDMEELDVQCAGELSCGDNDDNDEEADSDDDDEEDNVKVDQEIDFPMLSPPMMDSSITIDFANANPNIDAPPTPPLTASSTSSSPGKKRLSLPLSPSSDIHVPFSWSQRTTRSMSIRHSHLQSQSQSQSHAEPKPPKNGHGTKRCLQLDLRGVVEGQGDYHLGTS
jgi:hypothetical protein